MVGVKRQSQVILQVRMRGFTGATLLIIIAT